MAVELRAAGWIVIPPEVADSIERPSNTADLSAADEEMTVEEWGRRLRLSPATAHRRVADGQIEVVNVGSRWRPKLRITAEAHRNYLARRSLGQGKRRTR